MKMEETLSKFIVTAHRIPTNYNDPRQYVVEAETDRDAIKLVQTSLCDFGHNGLLNYQYGARVYDIPEVKGRIIGTI